jgi:hypothetical protein
MDAAVRDALSTALASALFNEIVRKRQGEPPVLVTSPPGRDHRRIRLTTFKRVA